MESSKLPTDRYSIIFSYGTIPDSKDECAGTDISFGFKHGVEVRVTNRLEVPLTPDNLQSLSFSIPSLHIRLKGMIGNIGLFHYGNVEVYSLPPAPADKPDGDNETSLAPPLACFYLNEDVGEVMRADRDVTARLVTSECRQPEEITTDISPGQHSGSEDFYTCCSAGSSPATCSARWDSASGSTFHESPSLPGETPTSEGQRDELIYVSFKGKRYARVLSRLMCADGDVDGTWTVTDFTERGELVFSLRLDFIRPRPTIPRGMARSL
ncbi:uncharacterized protein LOC134021646 [Osmerus eperlanus]|uniref:uncharacterized protein LOC134021646 n=1 Tax=Osmerus eperlanus TaxID=29151 RepID=UPI002E13AED8